VRAAQEGGWVLTVGFTLLFTALSALCAAYVVKAVQFFKARQAESRKLRTPEAGRQPGSPSEVEGDDLLELELLVRVTSNRTWWLVFQARAPPPPRSLASPLPRPGAARRRRGGRARPPATRSSRAAGREASACPGAVLRAALARAGETDAARRAMKAATQCRWLQRASAALNSARCTTTALSANARAPRLAPRRGSSRVCAHARATRRPQVTYILSMIMMAVSSIHVVVRAMDDLTILVFRNTWALQVVPLKHFGFVESCPAHDACKGVEAFYEVDAERGFIITSVRSQCFARPVLPPLRLGTPC